MFPTDRLTLQKAVVVLSITLTLVNRCQGQHSELPSECERGVKRHHPSQANVYQVFTRQDLQKQWLDYTCPEYSIFDPRLCQCVQSPDQHSDKPAKQRQYTRPEAPLRKVQHEVDDEKRHNDYQVKPKPERYQQQKSSEKPHESKDEQVHEKDHERKQDELQQRENGAQSHSGPGEIRQQKQETDCYLHRQTGHPSLFERWSDSQWIEEDCNWPFYTGLVWNQASCRCEWGPNRTVAVPNVEDSIPASCLLMLKITFDGGDIKDEGRHIWLNIKNKDASSVVSDSTAVGGKCGQFRGSSIAVPYFKSNVLGSVFHIGFMFKLCPGEPDTDIPLIHNDCIESGHDGPGLVVTYQAWKKQIIVSMRTVHSDKLVSEYCDVKNVQNQWTKLDIRYGENYMEVTANDQVCISSTKYYGLVATNNCPLSLLGEAFCGALDEVIITRGCTEAHAVSRKR